MTRIYLHDDGARLRFVVEGNLSRQAVEELDHAWRTAESIRRGRPLWIDLTAGSGADEAGSRLLKEMVRQGARLVTSEGEMDELARGLTDEEPRTVQDASPGLLRLLWCRLRRCCRGSRRNGCLPPRLHYWHG